MLVNPALLFGLLCLATFRVWRLAARDDITAPLRRLLPEIVLKPLVCNWCGASWAAIAAVLLFHYHVHPLGPNVWLWVAGVAAGVGFLGEIDARLDGD